MVVHISSRDIGRYVDGEVGREEARLIDRHLSACTYCLGRLEGEQRLAQDLKSHFAMPLPAGVHALPPRTSRPFAAPAAAAAVLVACLAYPAFGRDLQPPRTTGQSSVMQFVLGVRVQGDGPTWSQLSTWSGFVVGQTRQSLDLRVGGEVVRVLLPSGTQASDYSVGSAVTVRGIPAGHGVISAVAVQQVTP